MWRQRRTTDYFGSELVEGQVRDCISDKTIKELLERLCLAEAWILRYLLGEGYAVRAAAINVKVLARRHAEKPEKHFGDLYVVENIRTQCTSFKLYCPKENRFVWSVETRTPSDLNGYVDLKCNTHILHLGNSMYTFRFPDKKERALFMDNFNKFLYQQNSNHK